jgi:transposase-like protein
MADELARIMLLPVFCPACRRGNHETVAFLASKQQMACKHCSGFIDLRARSRFLHELRGVLDDLQHHYSRVF